MTDGSFKKRASSFHRVVTKVAGSGDTLNEQVQDLCSDYLRRLSAALKPLLDVKRIQTTTTDITVDTTGKVEMSLRLGWDLPFEVFVEVGDKRLKVPALSPEGTANLILDRIAKVFQTDIRKSSQSG